MRLSSWRRPLFPAAATGVVIAAGLSVFLWSNAASGADPKADPSTPEGFSSLAQTKADYGSAAATFGADFPADVKLPAMSERLQQLSDQSESEPIFEDGYVESELVTIWRCAWERSYFNANEKGDAKATQLASDQLARYYEIDAVKRWVDDPDHLWFQEVVEPANNGDFGPLVNDLELSCGAPFAVTK